MAEVKQEIKPEFKLDPADSPSNLGDIDEFDEAVDLYIPPKEVQAQGAWLVKVSPEMWKVWNDLYQNHDGGRPIEVGKLRVYHQKDGEESQRVQIRLNNETKEQEELPKAYSLEMQASQYNNTVVFSEKDLPGHRAQQFGGSKNYNGSKPTGIQAKNERYGPKKPGTYRTAIPKQTALAPPIMNEAIAKPVDDDSAMDAFKREYDAAMNAGKKTVFDSRIKRVKQPSAMDDFTFGTLSSKPGMAGKKKVPKEKAVRKTREELLDELQKCFREYQYWPLRALRNRTSQPEAWLKEVLEDIAYPMRSGDFAGNYRLNDASARLLQIDASQQQAAPDNEPSDQGTGDEMEDDDIEFEDVKTEG